MQEAIRPSAFVIMPFAQRFQTVFADIIQPAFIDYDVIRADTRLDERSILAKIVTGIDAADIIVADLTEMNPNVMYELGVAHALGKPVAMIAESVDHLPFDIRSYPVHEYGPEGNRADRLISLMREIAVRHRQGGILFGNPVADFVKRIVVEIPSATLDDQYTMSMCAADTEQTAQETRTFFETFNRLLDTLAVQLDEGTRKIRRGDTTSQNDLGLRQVATASRHFAREVDELAIKFHATWERYGRAIRWLLAAEQRPVVGQEAAQRWAAGARQTDRYLDDIVGSLADLRFSQASLPRHSGNLSHAIDQSQVATSNMLNELMSAKALLHWIMMHDQESV